VTGHTIDSAFAQAHLTTRRYIDALMYEEDLVSGQTIASYVVEVRSESGTNTSGPAGSDTGGWLPVQGTRGQTVGPRIVDVVAAIAGPATLRWSCNATLPMFSLAHLKTFAAYVTASLAMSR